MRIIAGSARGRRLAVPEGLEIRPTSDRVREATFNALHSRGAVEGASVLDLFAGSGALGLEALSRGAARAVFVDRSAPAVAAIRANVEMLGFEARATVVHGEAMDHLARSPGPVDVALLDPPYGFDTWPDLLERVDAAVVMIESDREIDVSPRWVAFRLRSYAGTVVLLARRATAADSEKQ